MSYENVPKNLTEKAVLVRGGRPDYLKLEADAFPVPTADEAGAILENTDTGDRYQWTSTEWVMTQIKGRDAPLDFYFEIGTGKLDGLSQVAKFGENPDIDIVSLFEVIWDGGGGYVPPTVPRVHDVASTSALDAGTTVSSGTSTSGSLTNLIDTGATFQADGVAVGDLVLNDDEIEIGIVSAIPSETEITIIAAMRSPWDGTTGTAISITDYRIVTNASTGASVLAIAGLDASRLELFEFVVLNGLVNVATTGTYHRQFRARVFGPNTTAAAGVVTSTAQTDLTVTCQVIDGNNQTLMAVYTVPFGKRGLLTNVWASLSKKTSATCGIILRAGILDGLGYVLHKEDINSQGTSRFSYTPTAPLTIPGGADVWMEADTNTNNTGVSGGFDIILEDE